MDIKEQILDYLNEGIVLDIIKIDQSLSLLKEIGENADSINKNKMGELFSALQNMLIDVIFIYVSRIFEKPNKKYKIRSIWSIIDLIEKNQNQLRIFERTNFIKSFFSLGIKIPDVSSMTDAELNKAFIQNIKEKVPRPEIDSTNQLYVSLNMLKVTRDKKIAHSEILVDGIEHNPTYKEVDNLVLFARNFVTSVG